MVSITKTIYLVEDEVEDERKNMFDYLAEMVMLQQNKQNCVNKREVKC